MKVVSLAGDWRGSVWEDAAGGPAGDAEATNHLRKRFKKIQIIILTGAKNKIQFKKSSDDISYWGNKTLFKKIFFP